MPVVDSYPLSPLQQGMLFHHLMAARSGVDIEQMVITLPEEICSSTLVEAWKRVVRQHPALRTSFRWEGLDQPTQDVHEDIDLPFAEHDWQDLAPAGRQDRFRAFLAEDRARGFVMSQAPLLRLNLFRMGTANYQLVWTFHHILLDGRAFPSILQEVFGVYEALEGGEENVSLPERLPYRDYIDWLQQRDWSMAKAFWSERLKGFRSPTPVVIDELSNPAPGGGAHASSEFRAGDAKTWLSKASTDALRDLAAKNQITLNTIVQAAWALLLNRYSGEKEVTFGAVRACRRSSVEGADSMVGLFINTLPMRVEIQPDAPLVDWLKDVRAQWISLREYEHTPLVQIQSWLGLPAGVPLFNTILMFEEYFLDARMKALGSSWTNRSIRVHEQTNYALTGTIYAGEELCLQIEFDSQRIDLRAVERMLGHLKTLLDGMASEPARTLSQLTLLTEGEEQLLTEWNTTRASYPDDLCVHQLFEAQVQQNPGDVAVETDRAHVTYGELNVRANRLAHQLRSLGVGPDVCVAICLERSLEMVVGLLAVLKAGGAYVPLDPAYPKDRLAYMIENARVLVTLTQSKLLERLPENLRAICLDGRQDDESSDNCANPGCAADPDHLAYVIYTSGSTGKPKGVAMPHRPLVNLLSWQLRNSSLPARAKTLQFASLSFDVSFQEIFSTWCAGGTLVLVGEETRRDPSALLRYIQQQNVQRLFLPFVALQQLSEVAGSLETVPGCLREIITAGEQLQATKQLIHFVERLGNVTLYNQYGPTESHVVTAFALPLPACEWPPLPPIGLPINNTQIYILDIAHNRVPIGVPGELHIGGVCLARGYLHQPELTRERFIPNPFGTAQDLLYRTGDLARYLPDGNIEFLGRIDHQVKVRGYRIELGEIEAVLAAHSSVQACAVTAYANTAGDKRLVAYVVPRNERIPGGELRTFLLGQLPEYMVPAEYVQLQELPLTPSGKVDRRNLPEPEKAPLNEEQTITQPRDLVEMQLVNVWERLLNRYDISITDNFFDLGGHSLLAVRMFGQIYNLFRKNIPLMTLFEAPTVEQLAARIRQEDSTGGWRSIVALQPTGSEPPLFCVAGGGGNLLAYRHLMAHMDHGRPCYGLQPPSLEGNQEHFRTIEEMAEYYLAELRTIQPHGPYFLMGWCIGGLVAFQMAQDLSAQSEEVAFLALVDTTFPAEQRPTVADRVRYHWRTMRQQGLAQAGPYALQQFLRIASAPVRNAVRVGQKTALKTFYWSSQGIAPRTLTEKYVLDADVAAAVKYRPQPYSGYMTMIWPKVKPEEAYLDSRHEWEAVALGGFEHIEQPGEHHSMFQEPDVQALAATLTTCLSGSTAASKLSSDLLEREHAY